MKDLMSQLRQYLSASSLRFPLEDGVTVAEFPTGAVGAGGTEGVTGEAACILMCRLRETFLSALYEQCGHA